MDTIYYMNTFGKKGNNTPTLINELRADLTTSKTCSLSVLLVDDDPIIRRAHTQLLKDLNCHVDVASDGQQALELLHLDHQVALLDIEMPGLNGIETAKKIRQRYKQMIIIGATANYTEDLKNECKKVGFTTVLRKPLNTNILQRILSRIAKSEAINTRKEFSLIDSSQKCRRTLTLSFLAFLGNQSPNKKQISVMESVLLNTGLKTELYFEEKLTRREQECLHLAALGYNTVNTADMLKISKRTVEMHRNEIKRKLDCKNITQAVFQGIEYGYIRAR